MRASTTAFGSLAVGLGLWAFLGLAGWSVEARAAAKAKPGGWRAEGEALFLRKWHPNDTRSHGGDGLGPVFNERSCVGCHRQGRPGGGGPSSRNVQILTPILVTTGREKPDARTLAELARVVKAQTGFRSSGSVVLHRFGTSPQYKVWREWILKQSQFSSFSLRQSERNTPALFGAGLIDAVPDAVLEAAAGREFAGFPAIKGRVSRLRDGRIGRFGWKGHTATLADFVLTACSVELGLEVPGHHQSEDLSTPSHRTPELDMTGAECDSLVAYVRDLPAPAEQPPASASEARLVAEGAALFEAIGCATCHTPKLGNVQGLYSDLLLHDMGPSLSDSAAYYGIDQEITDTPPTLADASASKGAPGAVETPGATSQEWRTPPLWGLGDSAPYLHDGRAPTIDAAIRAHGGQAGTPAENYARLLSADQRKQLLRFLASLTAPPGPRREMRAARVAPAVLPALRNIHRPIIGGFGIM